tara:strand:+ start:249 stop:434 length:186 start_codon:yes stop_codon:yes gene_type:complete
MVKTYGITITYEATLTTEMNLSIEDIENALWVGDQEIGLIRLPNGSISIRADAIDYEVQEE